MLLSHRSVAATSTAWLLIHMELFTVGAVVDPIITKASVGME